MSANPPKASMTSAHASASVTTRPRALSTQRDGFAGPSLCPVRSMVSEVGVGTEGALAIRPDDDMEGSEMDKQDSAMSEYKDQPCQSAEEEAEWTYPEGGLRAWLVVLGCWLFAASQLSTGMVWGVLLGALKEEYPDVSLSILTVCGGLGNFVSSSGAVFAGRLGDKYGYERIILIGAVSFCVSLVLSAFAYKNLVSLYIVQGCLLGVSIGLGFPLTMSMPSMWFKRRRGLATGIATSGTGFGGALMSLLLRALLPRVASSAYPALDSSLKLLITQGYRNTMLIWAGVNAVLSVVAFSLIKSREPPLKPGQKRVEKNWFPRGVWSDMAWWSLTITVFVGIFGYLVPFTFLVTYTSQKFPELKGLQPAVPLICGNAASGFGRIASGFLADRFGPVNMLFASFLVGGLLQAIFWPLTQSYGSIIAFAVLYGFSASWFVSLLPVAAAQLFGTKGLATITGFMVLANAPGMFVGAVIGGAVLDAAGGSYKAVAYYGGSTMLVGAMVLLFARFERERRLFARF